MRYNRSMSKFMDIWLGSVYDKLSHRANAFNIITSKLEELNRPVIIIETGCSRYSDSWHGDGNSTVIWDNFVSNFGGEVYSVDIDPNATIYAKTLVSDKTTIFTSDSVEWLKGLNLYADLLYLDSYDIDWNNPEPSMKHHENELKSSMHIIKPGSIVAVDDNLENVGKGYMVEQIAKDLGWTTIVNEYIKAWVVI
jgi:hypothetical protein